MAAISNHTYRHIPNELLYMIVEHLRPSFGVTRDEIKDDKAKRNTLATVCRLSRDLHSIATPILFETLDLVQLGLDRVWRLLDQCLLNPQLALYVRRIHIGSWPRGKRMIRLSRHGVFQTILEAFGRFDVDYDSRWMLEEEIYEHSNDVMVQLSCAYAHALSTILFLAACQRIRELRYTAKDSIISEAQCMILCHLEKAHLYETLRWLGSKDKGYPFAELTSIHLRNQSLEDYGDIVGMLTDVAMSFPGLDSCTLQGSLAPPLDHTFVLGRELRRLAIIDPKHKIDGLILRDILEKRPRLEEFRLVMFDRGNHLSNLEIGLVLREFGTGLRKLELRYDNVDFHIRPGHLGSLEDLVNLESLVVSTKIWPGDGRNRFKFYAAPKQGRLPQSLQYLTLVVPRYTDEYAARRHYIQLLDLLGATEPLPALRCIVLDDTEREVINREFYGRARSLVAYCELGNPAACGEVRKFEKGYITEIIFDLEKAEMKRRAALENALLESWQSRTRW